MPFIVRIKYSLDVSPSYREFCYMNDATKFYNSYQEYDTVENITLFKCDDEGNFKVLMQHFK